MPRFDRRLSSDALDSLKCTGRHRPKSPSFTIVRSAETNKLEGLMSRCTSGVSRWWRKCRAAQSCEHHEKDTAFGERGLIRNEHANDGHDARVLPDGRHDPDLVHHVAEGPVARARVLREVGAHYLEGECPLRRAMQGLVHLPNRPPPDHRAQL
eukprot:CAMPEP_0180413540 /NCGR_PEP_ID=MMETSP0989-20121125/45127_1 /TAXON_ID=697907 /ORGANISM="non described non described, Strain CCMP2293" /LENGTH=153 /DNA_ID=CAMNT_0022418077 /DNA_START=542 /DNA_END=1001 /DNA_ORIENTATION=+